MDGIEYEIDGVKQAENAKEGEKQSLCGSSNILRKLSRHLLREKDLVTSDSSSCVERKLSSNWTYKLRDDKSAVKTLWPIACREYLFLPEFKVHSEGLEDNYEIVEFIAKGSFGKVWKVSHRKTSQIHALKVLEKSKIILDNCVGQIKDEVSIQQAISHHPFIVTSQEHWQNKGYIYQLSEFIGGGELFQSVKHFTHKLVQLYVAELATVIEFLHNAGIIYRDLKSENILLDENYHVKLIDFGLSKWLKHGQRTFTICGTKNSMAPEIFEGSGYTHAVDWYSLGVLAKRMLTNNNKISGRPPEYFDSFDQVDDVKRNHDDNSALAAVEFDTLDAASKDLLNRLLEKNPQYRLKSILALQRIAFFHNFNIDEVRHKKITESLDLNSEDLGLAGIKFLLDEGGDIIFLNDLFSLQVVSISDENQTSPTIWSSKSMMEDDKSKLSTGNESADILFCCETFEVLALDSNGAALLFRSFTGHHIEFRTNTIKPIEKMSLKCEGWCILTCKRIKKDQSVGQSIQYTLLPAFEEKFFSDVVIKSCDGYSFEVHSPILRLNGFDCSSLNQSTPIGGNAMQQPQALASNFLSPPTIHLSTFNFSPNFVNHISNSFNCLAPTRDSNYLLAAPLNTSLKNGQISSSDSHLNNLQENVFNFPSAAQQTPEHLGTKRNEHKNKAQLRLSSSQIIFKNPTSPFRVRSSPLPFLNLSIDTPSSPLTSVSVLFNLTKDTLIPVLHWLYSESLPQNLSEAQLEALLKLCTTISPLNKMSGPCKKYLRLIKLKKVIVDIFLDIHECLSRMTIVLNPYTISRDPSSMCEVFKQCLREMAIGFALFLQLSQIFSKDTFLNRFQRNEIIKWIKSRIPIVITQFHQILHNVLVIIKSLHQEEKDELVQLMVPEIILALDVTIQLLADFKNSLEVICKSIQGDQDDTKGSKRRDQSHSNASAVLFLHVCEIKQLHDIYGKVNSVLEIIQHKQLTFTSMSMAERQSCLSINMDHLQIEIPIAIERLEELSKNMDDKLGWKEFKFCFKFATSHINGILSKLLEHKDTLLYPMLKLTQLVNRSAFTEVINKLELLHSDVDAKNFDDPLSDNVDSELKMKKDYSSFKINIFSGLCEPPNAINSNLAKNALKLLHSGNLADMEFEVITTVTTDCAISYASTPVSIITPSNDEFDFGCDGTVKKEYHVFKAHRVIVASRCEHLRKALLSGMQEDINRKITIYDTSPVIFRRFLLYLYGAPVDKNVGLESICELMLLADRYSVDSLKEVCEQTLISMIDCDSVICMLGIADRFNANTLKTSCLSFISQHIELTSSENFSLLSSDLQSEVFDLIQWRKRCTVDSWTVHGRYDEPFRSRHSLKSPSRPSRSRKSSPNSSYGYQK